MINFSAMLFAYIGPETILPLASAIAAIGGVVMMFWNSICRAFAWCLRKLKRNSLA